jgi:tRNA(fMet)-specific endonuclease VapC
MRYLLDTDTLSLIERGHQEVINNLMKHPPHTVFISIISVEEQLQGWNTLLRKANTDAKLVRAYDQFTRGFMVLQKLPVLPFSAPALQRFETFRTQKLGVGTMDIRIAAIAIEDDAIVVTSNKRDYDRIPGVQSEDWRGALDNLEYTEAT